MDKFLIFTIVGLSLSAIYAVIASGLVLTYTTTGVFNFAHGAIGMLAAFAYWQLRFDWGWPAPIALVVVLMVLAPAFGLLLERVIMRGLQGTGEATKLVVSISLLVAMIGLATLVWKPGRSRPMSNFFASSRPIDVGPTTITYHQAITIVVAILAAGGLRYLLYRTRIGVSMRANVDDRSLSMLNGAHPDRVALLSWAIGASLAAVGGILIAPSLSLEPGSLSLLIVNAYAAAVFGRLRSIPITFVGAIVVGLTEGYLAGYLPGDNRYLAGLRPAAAVVVLFLVLLAIPNRTLRSRTQLREFFPAPSPGGILLLAAGVVVGAVVLVTTVDVTTQISYGQLFPLGIVALSLVPLVGFAGQISLAQLSFAGVGAVVVAHHGGGGSPTGLLLAVVIAALVGGLVALPVLRLSGIYLALATAAFAVMLDRWIFILPDFDIGPVHFSLFQFRATNIDPLRLGGFRFLSWQTPSYGFDTPGSLVLLSAIGFALVAFVVAGVRWSPFGRALVAMRDSEAACATFGLNPIWPRLAVFMLSAGIAGLGGALYGMQLGTVSPERFDLVAGLPIFMLVVVGGAGLVGGALFASVLLYGVVPATSALTPFVAKLNAVTPGLVGVGMGRSPSGAVPLINEGLGPLGRDRSVLGSLGLGLVVAYGLRVAGVYENWPFVIISCALVLVAAAAAASRSRPDSDRHGPVPVDIEWAGVTSPWLPEQLTEMNHGLGLDDAAPEAGGWRVAAAVGGDGDAGTRG